MRKAFVKHGFYMFSLYKRNQIIAKKHVAGLIAEAIRRHHYCESVAMISYCLNSQPLAKEPTGDGGSRKTSSNTTAAAAATPKVVERTNSGGNTGGILPRHPGLDRLRKPYRLSSKCWD